MLSAIESPRLMSHIIGTRMQEALVRVGLRVRVGGYPSNRRRTGAGQPALG